MEKIIKLDELSEGTASSLLFGKWMGLSEHFASRLLSMRVIDNWILGNPQNEHPSELWTR